jgi:hypothetical protein
MQSMVNEVGEKRVPLNNVGKFLDRLIFVRKKNWQIPAESSYKTPEAGSLEANVLSMDPPSSQQISERGNDTVGHLICIPRSLAPIQHYRLLRRRN